ncbi:MAG: LPS assembly lipoprotein LptE, partial [Planctomycetota bacterium]
LPQHIQTLRVGMFTTKTKVFYYGLESKLTRALSEKIAKDPRVQLVNENEDALVTGQIVSVDKSILRETKTDTPSMIRLTIKVRVSLKDQVEGEYIFRNITMRSSSSSSGAGVYDLDRGQGRSQAETQAIDELAAEITRRIIATW